MASTKEPIKYSATLKQTTLQCQIDWTVEDYLTWSDLKEDLSEQYSPDFQFYFPEVNKTYVFALKIRPKGEKSDANKDLAIYLMNQKPESVYVKAEITVGTKVSTFIHSYDSLGGFGFSSLLTSSQLLSNRNEYLPNGNLNIKCKFFIIHTSSVIAKDVGQVSETKDDLCRSMEKLLEEDTLTDFDIICGLEWFPCHKSVLANRSEVFAAIVYSNSCEENNYPIEDYSSKVVKQMINFIYTNRLPEGSVCSTELLLIADRFKLKGLIKLCEARLASSLTVSNAVEILDTADKVADASGLKNTAIDFVADNLYLLIGTDDWNNLLGKNIKLLNSILKTKF